MAARDQALQQLYQSTPKDFTAERKRLATELRGRGDEAAAKDLAARRRPTTSAWAVNQLYWHARDAFDDMLAAAKKVRKGDLDATGDLRDANAALRKRAAELLKAAGLAVSEALIRRVSTTLSAIAANGGSSPTSPARSSRSRSPGLRAHGPETVGRMARDAPSRRRARRRARGKARRAPAEGVSRPSASSAGSTAAASGRASTTPGSRSRDASARSPPCGRTSRLPSGRSPRPAKQSTPSSAGSATSTNDVLTLPSGETRSSARGDELRRERRTSCRLEAARARRSATRSPRHSSRCITATARGAGRATAPPSRPLRRRVPTGSRSRRAPTRCASTGRRPSSGGASAGAAGPTLLPCGPLPELVWIAAGTLTASPASVPAPTPSSGRTPSGSRRPTTCSSPTQIRCPDLRDG